MGHLEEMKETVIVNPSWLIVLIILAVIAGLLVYYTSTRDRRSEPDAYERAPLPTAPSGWPVIARAENGLTANMIQNMLESRGIDTISEESHLSRIYFAGNEPASMNVPIYVEPGKEDEARRILEDSDFAKHLV